MAEETKKPQPGAGLCPGYTISRAILSDAVALVRGDRMLSIERTPAMMTCWGYKDTEPEVGRGMMAKVTLDVLRTDVCVLTPVSRSSTVPSLARTSTTMPWRTSHSWFPTCSESIFRRLNRTWPSCTSGQDTSHFPFQGKSYSLAHPYRDHIHQFHSREALAFPKIRQVVATR
jgi:hypothetical protein